MHRFCAILPKSDTFQCYVMPCRALHCNVAHSLSNGGTPGYVMISCNIYVGRNKMKYNAISCDVRSDHVMSCVQYRYTGIPYTRVRTSIFATRSFHTEFLDTKDSEFWQLSSHVHSIKTSKFQVNRIPQLLTSGAHPPAA